VQPPVLPIALPSQAYSRLAQLAEAQERDPVQQARWLLRQALEDPKRAAASAEAVQETVSA
jgi:hypothetical protein